MAIKDLRRVSDPPKSPLSEQFVPKQIVRLRSPTPEPEPDLTPWGKKAVPGKCHNKSHGRPSSHPEENMCIMWLPCCKEQKLQLGFQS